MVLKTENTTVVEKSGNATAVAKPDFRPLPLPQPAPKPVHALFRVDLGSSLVERFDAWAGS